VIEEDPSKFMHNSVKQGKILQNHVQSCKIILAKII